MTQGINRARTSVTTRRLTALYIQSLRLHTTRLYAEQKFFLQSYRLIGANGQLNSTNFKHYTVHENKGNSVCIGGIRRWGTLRRGPISIAR
jgi:hypothetical protein